VGVLDTLGQIDQGVKDATGAVLDNDAFSVQDTVRGTVEAATGFGEDGTEDFAQDSARAFQDINRQAIAAPGRAVGEATQGTAVDNALTGGAVEGGEALYEILAEDVGAIAYGSVTGANVRTNDPTHATDGYTPGALDTFELLATVGTGGGGKVATSLGKGAVKAGSKANMSLLDEGATALSRLVRRGGDDVAKTADDTAKKATDDAVQTRKQLDSQYKNTPSRKPEPLTEPDYLGGGALAGSLSKVRNLSTGQKIVGGGALGLGALGLAGAPPFPQGYTRTKEYTQPPGGVRVKETDNAGTVLGYWVVLGSDGGDHTVLLPDGGTGTTTTVDFPTSRSAPFSSPDQADTAFTRYADAVSDPPNQGPTTDNSQPNTTNNGEWGEARILKPLNSGWVLAEQPHRTETEYRYLVVGKNGQGQVIFLNAAGEGTQSLHAFGTQDKAMTAYQNWKSTQAGETPAPAQDRPTPAEIASKSQTTSFAGSIGSVGVLLAGGTGLALLLYVLYRRVLA